MNASRRHLFWFSVVLAALICCPIKQAASADPDEGTAKNTALIPTPKLEQDSYDWYARHEAVLKTKDSLKPEVVMIGDSITHFWAGPPKSARQSGLKSWRQLFGNHAVLNMGFGWDRTQNVLWRLEHGEFDGLLPKHIVLNIGTNNFSKTTNAKDNTPAEVAEAIGVICSRLHDKSPESRILIMGVLPRGEKPDDPYRIKIAALNKLLPEVAKSHNAAFLDIGAQFLNPDGTIPSSLMFDFCHPSEQGYAIWAKALEAQGIPGVPQGSTGQDRHGSADYVVYRESADVVCLQSVRSGEILKRAEDAGAILQKAIDLLPENGGKVYVAGGSYRLGSTVVISGKHGVHLEGAARGMNGPGKGGTVLWSDKPIHLLEIFGKTRVWGITVSNLLLYGSGKDNGKAGIWMHGTTDVMTFNNVGANNCGIGFHIEGAGGENDGKDCGVACVADAAQFFSCDPQMNGIGLLVERAHYMKIVGGEFSDCLKEGIRLSGPHPGAIQGVKIIGVTAIRCAGAGIRIGKNCDDITVTGGTDVGGTRQGSGIVVSAESADKTNGPTNVILSDLHSYCNQDDGILLDRAQHVIVSNSICSVHRHGYVAAMPQKAGIRVKPSAEDVVVTGNITYGNQEKGIVDETGKACLSGNSDRASEK